MTTPSERQAQNQKLVQELVAMRDALLTLSLCLKDWQFELDQQGRLAAQKEADAVLGPMRTGPGHHQNMMHIKKPGDSFPG